MITRFLGNYLILAGGLIAVLGVAGQWLWLLNALTAAIGALAVIIGSHAAYKRMVESRVESEAALERDAIGKIEDPYDLYDEDEEKSEEKSQKPPFKERARLLGGALSPMRLLGYMVLILGFFLLDARGLFMALPYLSGLMIVPVAALMLFWQNRKG